MTVDGEKLAQTEQEVDWIQAQEIEDMVERAESYSKFLFWMCAQLDVISDTQDWNNSDNII